MRNEFHLLIVDCERRAVLAGRFATRWLLPVVGLTERARAEPAISRWTAEQGVRGELAGQWLGRLTPSGDSIDWLAVLDAKEAEVSHPALDWLSLDELMSSRSLIGYQKWSVATTLQSGGPPSVPGPFGNLAWLGKVKNWIAGIAGDTRPRSVSPYRITAHEVVLGAETTRGRVYFKGLTGDRAGEPRITRVLSQLEPRTFAATLALEKTADDCVWWLTAECPGKALAERASVDSARKVARALARVQRRAMASADVLGELQDIDLPAAAAWSADLLGDSESRTALERACDEVRRANVPRSWIPLDLDPVNVLVDDDGRVSFIDLDDSFLGPVPLAMATFARRCRDDSVCRAYEEAWPLSLTRVNWRAFALMSAVLEAWLGWQRVVKNTARGEVHGVLDLARDRLARRLAAVVHLRYIADPSATGRSLSRIGSGTSGRGSHR